MALLAEALVEEWLNRQGYFTIRGSRSGLNEIDLLAVRCAQGPCPEAWHVEVQVSFRPVGYIARPSSAVRKALGVGTGAANRTPEQLDACAREWVDRKFTDASKNTARNGRWPDLTWSYALVHGKVKDRRELVAIQQEGVTLISFDDVLFSLVRDSPTIAGAGGGDIAEVLRHVAKLPTGAASARLPPQPPPDDSTATQSALAGEERSE